MENYKSIVEKLLNKGANNIKKKTIILNANKPIFKNDDFNITEWNPKYFGIDKYGRITGAIAMISKNTIPIITEKELEYPRPYGWTKTLENKDLFESCHIIAYNLSAQTTDKENLFIGTNDLNTSIMKQIENTVNNYIKNYNFNVLYKVSIKYRGTDQIPLGILIEAQAINDDFSICSFCYNIEKKVKFDYSNGKIIYDNRNLPKTKKNKQKIVIQNTSTKINHTKNTGSKRNFFLNTKTKICHYSKNCKNLKSINSKYIQGTRTTESVILSNDFKLCNKCKNEN